MDLLLRESIKFIKDNLKGHLIGAEVGVSNGRHSKQIKDVLDCDLYLVDIWEDYQESFIPSEKTGVSKKNSTEEEVKVLMRRYKDIHIIKQPSVKASKKFKDGFFDFVYIDANHTYENVIEDIKAWRPKVRRGGVLCGHDYTPECEGVMKAVDELVPTAISIWRANKITIGAGYIIVPLRYPDWYTVI